MSRSYASWTFFSNHGHVFFLLAMHEGITLKDVATQVGITERAVLGIIQDLDEADYLTRHKVGRSNRYKINLKKPLRHPLESNVKIQDLVKVLTKAQSRLNHK